LKAKKKDPDEALEILKMLFQKIENSEAFKKASQKRLAEKKSSKREIEIVLRVVGEKKIK
jgi:hypothetical protein